MKKNILFLIIPVSILVGCCDKCNNIFTLADLLLDSVEQSFSEEGNEKVYKLLHTILNSTKDITCPSTVAVADTHRTNFPIKYSPDGNFNPNSEVVQSQTVTAGNLQGGGAYKVESSIIFAVDGYYHIITDIDIDSVVPERYENNNHYVNAINGLKVSGNYSDGTVMHITNTGRSKPELDKNGKPIYIKKWDIRVIQ